MKREAQDESNQRVMDGSSSTITYCIAIGAFSMIAGVVLAAFGAMIRAQSITFAILCEKHEWDCDMKGMACLRAAVAYFAITGMALFVGCVAKIRGAAAARRKSQRGAFHITTQADGNSDVLFSGINE